VENLTPERRRDRDGVGSPREDLFLREISRSQSDLDRTADRSAEIVGPSPCPRAPAPCHPAAAATPSTVPSIARRHARTHGQRVANYYSRYTSHRFVVHRQRRLLFIVHHIAVPVTTRSYNTTTDRIRRAALFRIALQRYVAVTNGTEGESERASARSFPRVRARVCACRYTACTLVKIQSEHESAMGTFIVHSYVVLSALHYAIVFSTPPPPALLLIMRITIISLCASGRAAGREGGTRARGGGGRSGF